MSATETRNIRGTKVAVNDLLTMQKALNIDDNESALILRGLRQLGVDINIGIEELKEATAAARENAEEYERLLSALELADHP